MLDCMSQPRRSAHKHAAILDAASALVAEQGYTAVSMEAIAARAGVGKQTLYRWWPGKPALYIEVYTHLTPAAMLAIDTGTLPGDLSQLLDALLTQWISTPAADILAGLIGESQHDPAARAALAAGLVVGRADLLAEPLRRAIRRGELSAGTEVGWVVDKIVAILWHAVLINRAALGPALRDRLIADILAGG